MPPKVSSAGMVSAVRNPSSTIMAIKVPEPGEPATSQDIKFFLLHHPVGLTAPYMVLLPVSFPGLVTIPGLPTSLKR